MFKSKMKCIPCGNAHNSVNKNCTIRRKKMKKQRKTTVFLFSYYFTFSFSSGSDSVFCSFKSRPLTVPKPQSPVSSVIKKKHNKLFDFNVNSFFMLIGFSIIIIISIYFNSIFEQFERIQENSFFHHFHHLKICQHMENTIINDNHFYFNDIAFHCFFGHS